MKLFKKRKKTLSNADKEFRKLIFREFIDSVFKFIDLLPEIIIPGIILYIILLTIWNLIF